MSHTAPDPGPWTVARLLQWTRDYLARQGVESPRLCSEILLAHALDCERLHLFTRYEEIPAEAAVTRFRTGVRDAAAGKPIAYITGTKEFYSLALTVTPDVLVPRPETELLVERTITLVRKAGLRGPRILDLGTGSGCIAIALAVQLPEAEIAASDVSAAALAVARDNAARHGVAERIDFREGDLLAPWADAQRAFDVIVSNPPYVAERARATLAPTVREFEPAGALFAGTDGLDVIRRVLAEAPPRLAPGGDLLVEIGHDQADAAGALASDRGWVAPTTYRDSGGHLRVLHVQRAAVERPAPVS